MRKQYTINKSERTILNVARVLLSIAVFLAVFAYESKVVLCFLFTALFLLLLYYAIPFILPKLLDNKIIFNNQNQAALSDIISFGSTSIFSSITETYLVFDADDFNIFESKNITSIVNKGNNNFIVNLIDPLGESFELETMGIDIDEVKVRESHFNLKLKKQPHGLVAIKISCTL